jgi:hypothetical protein
MTAIGIYIMVVCYLAAKLLEMSELITPRRSIAIALVFSVGILLLTGGVCTLLWEHMP